MKMTSEFWIVVVVIVGVVTLLLTKTVSEDFAKWVLGISVGAYPISRGLSKINGVNK